MRWRSGQKGNRGNPARRPAPKIPFFGIFLLSWTGNEGIGRFLQQDVFFIDIPLISPTEVLCEKACQKGLMMLNNIRYGDNR
jgi:hypothetical protein